MSGDRVVGVDQSLTSLGLAFADGTTRAVKPRVDGVARLVQLRDAVLEAASGVDLVVIEGYSFGSRHSHAHALGELGGVLRVALYEADVPFVVVTPRARAKWVTGNGNARKEAVVSSLSARLGRVFDTSDEADAWALRDVGLALLTGTSQLGMTDYRRDVLAALEDLPSSLPSLLV